MNIFYLKFFFKDKYSDTVVIKTQVGMLSAVYHAVHGQIPIFHLLHKSICIEIPIRSVGKVLF